MTRVYHQQLSFGSLFGKEIVADFEGGQITSDGGGLLLREVDRRYGLTEALARCLDDPRDPDRLTHELTTLVRQRLFSIALGYEDTNDAATLRRDPALKAMSGRLPESNDDLASQFRLLLHTAAYCLFLLLRRHLEGTEFETAQVGTLRLKLLKIGARVRETKRRVWFHLASGYPYQPLFARLLQDLRASPT